jgi:type IV pilus assembly protein PilN
VETLQTNRTEAVHLLDQLVRQLPDGIYLRSVRQQGTRVTLIGYAQSNARVSTLMRNIESSPWLFAPELVEIKSVPMPGAAAGRDSGQRISEFTLNLQVKRAAPPPDSTPAPSATPKPGTPVPSPAPAAAKGGKS